MGCNKFTVLGVDSENATAVPLYVGLAKKTHVRIGHPVVATGEGAAEMFIQVTRLRVTNGSTLFHVAVNNPTQKAATVHLSASFPEVGLQPKSVTLQPGEHRVVQ